MSAIPFDTLKAARSLRDAGFADEQASAIVETFSEGLASDLVTKEHLDARLESLEQRMTIKLGSLMLIGVGAAAAIVGVIVRLA